ncbi:FAD-dependent oxidoreductase [Brucella gallinifaecis]|uniref:FAD-dependent oxidoreductase n=1 Tax=Brucella gallinifaecis TaxID=215590 RepID=A0A502BLZ4_9HYPH|nr:FAD-dependent oxidoreductase [Brucella gallinifaecis]TPF74709.1 FAD-dependent oxidoreductase [Brucella gallinifaecis]
MTDLTNNAAASRTVDVIVVGSGSAALSAALTSARSGLQVVILEKSALIGGTSAMSGAGTWIPANHHATAAGIKDSKENALAYLRATAPEGWGQTDDHLWQAFVDAAPEMLKFLEANSPLRFEIIAEPDPFTEAPGGVQYGRMLSPRALSRNIVGKWANRIRRSTMPHLFSYKEAVDSDFYGAPVRSALRLGPTLIRRYFNNEAGQGSALITGLLKGCLDAGCEVLASSPVTDLIIEKDDRVAGVVFQHDGKHDALQTRKGVVLATGGFEWDEAMLRQYFPGAMDRLGSPSTNTGDGHKLALKAGARLEHMDQANVYPTIPTIYEGKLQGLPITFQISPHAIVVNRHGKRFASEYDFNLGEILDYRDPETGEAINLPAWLIADTRFIQASAPFRRFASKQPGWIKTAASLDDLAAKIGIDQTSLKETVQAFNRYSRNGKDEEFQRGDNAWERYKSGAEDATAGNPALGGIEKGPFVAMSFNRSILGTKGGAKTNEKGQVLRENGTPISGLYCAGLTMANPIGTRAIGPGTTIGPCLTWGYICGRSLSES